MCVAHGCTQPLRSKLARTSQTSTRGQPSRLSDLQDFNPSYPTQHPRGKPKQKIHITTRYTYTDETLQNFPPFSLPFSFLFRFLPYIKGPAHPPSLRPTTLTHIAQPKVQSRGSKAHPFKALAAMDWTRGRAVGRGASATVSVATCRRSGDVFAVKSAELVRSRFLRREQQILSSLSSPRIVSYRGCEITCEDEKTVFNLFMEYLPKGSLADQIRSHGGKLDESDIRVYARQILEGLDYLHSRGIAHCDIKSSNVLIGDDGAVKIADFGCAKPVGPAMPAGEIGGTPMFMAPEAARGEEQGLAGDAWAVGCTVIEMATGRSPWQSGADPVSVLYRIACSGELPAIPGCLSAEARDFVGKCLKRNPRERWTVGELLEHPFLENHKAGSSQAEQINTKSPTSVLGQEFWSAMDETGSEATTTREDGVESALDRIRTLSFREGRRPNWPCDGGWITVRTAKREGALVEELGIADGSDSDRDGTSSSSRCFSWVSDETDASADGGGRLVGLPSGNAGGGICGNSCDWAEECVVIRSSLKSKFPELMSRFS